MPGRKPVYQSHAERPVTLSVRVPRALYDQLQDQLGLRHMSLTDAVRDALQRWVETPANPLDFVVSYSSNTSALQQFDASVGARLAALEAAVAALRREAPASTARIPPSSDTVPYDKSMIDVIQEIDAAPPADETPRREGHGALAGHVRTYAAQHQGAFTCIEVVQALHANAKQVNQVLKRLVKQGLLASEGQQRQTVYVWRG